MATCLLSIASCCACNIASCAASAMCSCLGSSTPCKKSIFTRIAYVAVFAVISFLAFVMKMWGSTIISWIPVNAIQDQYSKCSLAYNTTTVDSCIGSLAAIRVAFALALFHLILAVVMIGVRSSKDPRSVIQDGWWGLKLILIIGFIIMAFFIPTPFYEGWAWISLFGSAIFILAQLVLLVDFAHSWTESWAEYYNKMEQKIWLWLLIICTGILFIGGLVLTILTYVFFVKGENCQMNIAFPTINIFFAVLYTIVSVHPTIQEANHGRSGLLQASVVFVYTSYLVWSSINSEPLTWKCNGISSGSSTVAIVIGAVFAILAVCYSAFTTSGSTASIVGTSEDKEDSSQGEPLVNKIDEKKKKKNQPLLILMMKKKLPHIITHFITLFLHLELCMLACF